MVKTCFVAERLPEHVVRAHQYEGVVYSRQGYACTGVSKGVCEEAGLVPPVPRRI